MFHVIISLVKVALGSDLILLSPLNNQTMLFTAKRHKRKLIRTRHPMMMDQLVLMLWNIKLDLKSQSRFHNLTTFREVSRE